MTTRTVMPVPVVTSSELPEEDSPDPLRRPSKSYNYLEH